MRIHPDRVTARQRHGPYINRRLECRLRLVTESMIRDIDFTVTSGASAVTMRSAAVAARIHVFRGVSSEPPRRDVSPCFPYLSPLFPPVLSLLDFEQAVRSNNSDSASKSSLPPRHSPYSSSFQSSLESRSHCGTTANSNVPVSHDRLNESTVFPMNLNLFSSDKVRDLTLLCTQLRGRFFSGTSPFSGSRKLDFRFTEFSEVRSQLQQKISKTDVRPLKFIANSSPTATLA